MNSHISLSPSLTVLLCCPCAVTFSKCGRILLLRLGAGEFLLCCQGESWESWAWVVGMERALCGDVPGRAMGVVPALNLSVGVALEPVVPIQPCPCTRGWKIKGILVSTAANQLLVRIRSIIKAGKPWKALCRRDSACQLIWSPDSPEEPSTGS